MNRALRLVVVDVALVLLVLGFSFAEVLTRQVPGPLWAGVVSAVGFSLPLAARRRHPWVVLVVVYTMLVFCSATDVSTYQYMGSVIGCVVALGTLAARAELVPSLVALAAAYVVLLLTALTDPGGWLWGGFILGAVWIGGRMMRQHRELIERLRATAAELEQSRALAEDAAATRERTRLAHELHDVIAHSVSVMVVQAGAAERMLALDPERAGRALGSVQATGREALSELRRLLGVLRTDVPSADGQLEPQPDLDDLDRLAEQLRETGLDLSVTRTGEVRPLGRGIELAAFRILQEALTNVLKHGHARRADVEVCYGPDRLAISVVDDGTGGEPLVQGSGHGVRGMTERAAMYGGTLEAGPRTSGGYAVRAELPIGSVTG
jgi:signal transduction histidine kinase